MAGSKLNAAIPGYENVVGIFGHSSGYFHGNGYYPNKMEGGKK